ncbi:Asp-tRNA(Asn)/Glu-tRNA(Gln) amidotransferase subunit GatB [archaeon]|jgi:aspartyl-tRNA(Asn)/glutamyl-tRNA(Gln) amidotransferase subunit B|nr:Asp-tRNA(Asn)/Glu-tRNA(Gln) amidotransferase subunit GatB [archaeon]MBT4241816.1 Asp-tRNA(Asn)/Glu-tRNA(Gln) amidotransferase subunit GatB [archaeon]MBT4418364.1 Asp-tRNA(Asn)/Glu-tRNA(Gln) amidotransferase subunit GatB [archaeon]
MKKDTKDMIGLEIHGYIETKEKLFCSCKNFHDMKQIKPNTNICPVCTGQPGSKPQLPNKSAIDKTLQIGLMLNCKPNLIEDKKPLIFQRKHYSWPDMPTGYQKTISGAYSIPVAEKGKFLGIRITEVHLEEDPAAWNPEKGTVDYNRAGVPLIEIVTEPDFTSAEQVQQWLRQLVLTLSYMKVLNKDAGIKADVNVNIKGVSVRAEIKNVNSITEIVKSIKSELKRHKIDKPKQQETRRWNSKTNKTELMRTKEQAADYRFIPEPDLPAIKITKKRIKEIEKQLPETPQDKLQRIIKKHKIDKTNAEILTQNIDIAELYEEVIKKIDSKFALPWITIEWFGVLNYNKKTMENLEINPDHIIELLELLQKNKITPLKTKEILRKFIPKSYSPKSEAKSEAKITNKKELSKITQKIIKENKKSAEDYKQGQKQALNFLIGKVMQETNKRADYIIVKQVLENELK